MGRGSGEVREASMSDAGNFGADYSVLKGQRSQLRSTLMPRATALADSQGYSPEEKAAITGRTMEANNAGFGAAEQQVENRAARTRNDAGAFGAMANVNLERARTKSDEARTLTQGFADEKQRRQMAGLSMLGQQYGIDTNLLSQTGGMQIGARKNAADAIGRWSAPFGISGG